MPFSFAAALPRSTVLIHTVLSARRLASKHSSQSPLRSPHEFGYTAPRGSPARFFAHSLRDYAELTKARVTTLDRDDGVDRLLLRSGEVRTAAGELDAFASPCSVSAWSPAARRR